MISSLFMNIVFTMSFLPFGYFNTFNVHVPKVMEPSLNTSKKNLVKLNEVKEDGYYVITSRAYFYTQPGYEFINTNKYLILGDYCDVLRYKNGFVYVNYYNTNNYKTTSGWLDLNNLRSESTY